MAATIKDVAELAKCSIKTVSRVINNEPYVSETTRRQVIKAITALDYVPNFSARQLVQKKAFMICILLHEAGYYQSGILARVLDIGYQQDYEILIQSYYPSHERSKDKLTALVREQRVDGLVITPPCDVDPFLLELLDLSAVPFVQISPLNRTADIPYVAGDEYQGAYLMTEQLIKLGHQRIAFLSGPRNHRASIDRLFGYKAALEVFQVPIREELILESLFNFDGGYNAAQIAMTLPDPPTAIFGGSDQAALGALYALKEMQLCVPGDVSVCGFDDLPQAQQVWPGLSTIAFPMDIIVEQAIKMLTSILAGREPEFKQVVLPSRLVIRGSTSVPHTAHN